MEAEARTVRAGYIALMLTLGVGYLAIIPWPTRATAILPWVLALSVALPAVLDVDLDRRADRDG